MANLDTLLRSLVKNGMDAALLAPGRLPRLVGGGVEHEVTQSVLDATRIAELVAEIAPADWTPTALPRFSYRLEDTVFECEVTPGPKGWSARLEPAGARDRRAISSIQPLLEAMLTRRASDLHLASGLSPWLRVDGEMFEVAEFAPLPSVELERLLLAFAPERNREQFREHNDTDFAHELPGRARFRVNLFRDHRGFGAVLRVIPQKIPSADDLGLPESVRRLAQLAKGLVLVTGPTGSGKSTTLAALVDLVNSSRSDHIITIEDPIEFVHVSKKCLVNQREVGIHTASFQQALRAALREDPDVVLVGEMRDLETAAMAVETAETGHLVFGTLHTTTAPSTIERLVNQFPGDRQSQIRILLADALRAVVAQTLLRKIGGGRIAAYEVLIVTPAVSNLIREGKTFQIASAMQTGKAAGMMLLNDALFALVEKKLVEPREAYLKAADKESLLARFKAAGLSLETG